jgi:hypothetical protein
MNATKIARAVAVLAGLFLVVFGLWAFFAPASFFERIATFKPYNRHLIHDIGAFQVGLGATLLIALAWKDALGSALLGNGLGAGMHAAAHWWDRSLGGRSSDPYFITALAVIVIGAGMLRARSQT